jgi:hypothetical protein
MIYHHSFCETLNRFLENILSAYLNFVLAYLRQDGCYSHETSGYSHGTGMSGEVVQKSTRMNEITSFPSP